VVVLRGIHGEWNSQARECGWAWLMWAGRVYECAFKSGYRKCCGKSCGDRDCSASTIGAGGNRDAVARSMCRISA